MQREGTAASLISEWNLPVTVSVDGIEAVRNA
jgi:hypothetical protein